ncbi:hypothetical protein CRU99_12710 [Malaciobacter mytili]|uniref:hypothetical protein n=1 Tax=Malaciobacter mytili TaxID=603050 RepID=UPI00100C1FFB|nr:hypothetical protein [Malaciobacter mytili]RXI37033.1 hypothetical protein CRU99_12710 [Malaciobacter mytili]
MKKFLIFLFSVLTIVNASNCKCTSEIDNIFDEITNYIVDDYVDPTSDNIEDILIPQIKTNKKSIDEQNKVLEKVLKAEKLKSLEAENLVFLLNKYYLVGNIK